ncbi:glycine cleavage system H protein, mitochondrial [Oratosquilla oratoria]|uniref:glycine cleavage system H protein, mitochondrial n=1 Tax=Oratosquilla oratoria TaxID=337810 RepID=UPI003F75BCF8
MATFSLICARAFSSRILTLQLQKALPSLTYIARNVSTSNLCSSARKYTEKHEWVLVDGNIGTIGITNYAQEALGDIVYAQLPEVGSEFPQMEECGALESVKAASELYCPVSGKVIEINSQVEDQPGLINQSCEDEGWLFKLELTVPEEFDDLMTEESYTQFLKEQE